MQWKWFRRMWQIRVSKYWAMCLTPWFALMVSTGSPDFDGNMLQEWKGIRLYHSHLRGWRYIEGVKMFQKKDSTLSYTCWPKEERQ